MVDQKLVDYVKTSLGSGMTLERIRADLADAGWPKNDIEEAIASAKGGKSRPKPAGGGLGKKKFYIIGLIIAVTAGVLTYYFASSYLLSLFYSTPGQPGTGYECGNGKCESNETYELCPADCAAPPVETPKVSLKPSAATASNGENVNLDVEITSVSNLYGFQFDVEYDPTALEYGSVTEGAFLSRSKADSTFCIDPKINSSTSISSVTVACTRLGAIGGVSGNGTLETVTFKAIKAGSYGLSLNKVKLVNTSMDKVNAEVVGSSTVTISG